ncbi:hypothetical protein JCM3770_004654 [Rhodotorula araucariae]
MSRRSRPPPRGTSTRDRSIRKARYLPALPLGAPTISDSEEPGGDPAAVSPESPVDPLRRVNVMLQFVGAGVLALGSTLVVSLYVTGPPRLNDMASSSTAVLMMTLLIGCLAVVPSWTGALVILIQKKPDRGMPPNNPRWLRFAALLSFFLAMLYVIAGLVLFVLLENQSSFVAFCMQNLEATTEENCTERYNRAWVIVLCIGVVFVAHVALGFPVYRYTRGPKYGVQLESGFLLEPGKQRRRRRVPLQRHPTPSAPCIPRGRVVPRRPISLQIVDMSLPLHNGASQDAPNRRPSSSHRPPALTLGGTSPRLDVANGASGSRLPHSPALHSPALHSPATPYGSPLLPAAGAPSYFTTLPPSPPLAGNELAPVGALKRSGGAGAYPTPPGSAPTSSRSRNGFETTLSLGGAAPSSAMERQVSRGSSILLGEDLHSGTDSAAKRRPSLILTSAPSEEPQGLAIAVDMGDGTLPSPLLGSAFSGSTSPLNSPAQSYFSTSPVNSPTFGAFPSPFLTAGSPTLGSGSVTTERVPSSPRLAGITDPLGRLATGLVRRASSNSLNAELPTSVKPPPSPTLSSAPLLSPSLPGVSGLIRRASFASTAREKEKEKEKEAQEREDMKRSAKYHARGFSWATRPDDPRGTPEQRRKAQTGTSKGLRKRTLALATLVVFGVLYFAFFRSRGATPPAQPSRAGAANRVPVGQRLQRRPDVGRSFIHPEVIERKKPASKSWVGAPIRAAQRLFGSNASSSSSTHGRLSEPRRTGRAQARPTASKTVETDKEVKRRSVFVARPHVEFVDHNALPPPVEHGDHPERDTLVLYRILGNDLPPRHSPGQTLRNLRFLLQHESDFSVLPPLGPHGVHHSHLYGSGSHAREAHSQMGGLRVDKYFVLNRIAEPEMVSAIIGLLHLYSVPDSRILVIPFDWNEYQRREFRWDGGVDNAKGWGLGDGSGDTANTPQKWHRADVEELSTLLEEADGDEARARDEYQMRRRKSETLGRLRALDFVYHEKNLYAMNNNGGRNFALQHGRSLPNARWILPLDGNSFFTPAAMFSIVRTLSIAGEGPAASRYVIIPMARLLNNDDVRANNTVALVPLGTEDSASAIVDAEIHHRPAVAPATPEEPQVGFRYDSTESFQEAMRYGRRSKLELLWRLGAVPYSRGLDRRTLPWEVTDRAHITAATWGSIPGVEGAVTKDSIIHAPHGEEDPWGEPNPPRGDLSYVKAGWVYRLFSGHKSQEEHSTQAATLRNTNRIRGIVAFLEHLDEIVARGEKGCFGEENPFHCGFHADRLWNFDMFDVERLRQKYRLHRGDALERVNRYEALVQPTLRDVQHALKDPQAMRDLHAQKAATASMLLAMAGYLTNNATYSNAASEFIGERFVRRTPHFYYRVDQHEQFLRQQDDDGAADLADSERDIVGYAFPPFPKEPGQSATWSAALAGKLSEPGAPPLPFDALTFDPLLLLDAIRLLTHPSGPKLSNPSLSNRKAFTPLINSHLSYLLFAPSALALSADPPSRDAGAVYDARVAALAAFLDDAQLVGRVANRARLRLRRGMRAEGLMDPDREVQDTHWRLLQGLRNLKVRPWSLAGKAEDEELLWAMHHGGGETPLAVLGL